MVKITRTAISNSIAYETLYKEGWRTVADLARQSGQLNNGYGAKRLELSMLQYLRERPAIINGIRLPSDNKMSRMFYSKDLERLESAARELFPGCEIKTILEERGPDNNNPFSNIRQLGPFLPRYYAYAEVLLRKSCNSPSKMPDNISFSNIERLVEKANNTTRIVDRPSLETINTRSTSDDASCDEIELTEQGNLLDYPEGIDPNEIGFDQIGTPVNGTDLGIGDSLERDSFRMSVKST